MLATVSVVVPIFGLVLAGYVCRWAGVFGPAATSELNRFVVWLGLPALMFDVTANASWADLYQPGFAAAFTLSCFIVFFLTLTLRVRKRGLADGSMDALNAAYPNSGYMGFPLGFLVFGPESFPFVTISAIVTVCVLFGFAIVLLEIGLQDKGRFWPTLRAVTLSLVTNPLLIAPALGILFAATGLTLPKSADSFLDLLGSAASPCALVALGTFMADRKPGPERDTAGVVLLTALKLLLLPGIAWVLGYYVFALPREAVNLLVLLCALPTGTGPFMLAEHYKRGGAITASTILYSTIVSVFTISAILFMTGHEG
jgi:malonate transporter and related proteins